VNTMKTLHVKAIGTKPLLMHNNQGVNPLHPLARELKTYTSKRTKTEEDLIAISDLEWLLGIYYDKEIGPYLPQHMIMACIENGAKKQKLGTTIVDACEIQQFKVPLLYNGPRDIESLKDSYEYRDVRVVGVQRSSVNRTRPRFEQWSIEFDLNYDENLIDEDRLKRCVIDAGETAKARLGDFSKYYGSFTPHFT